MGTTETPDAAKPAVGASKSNVGTSCLGPEGYRLLCVCVFSVQRFILIGAVLVYFELVLLIINSLNRAAFNVIQNQAFPKTPDSSVLFQLHFSIMFLL